MNTLNLRRISILLLIAMCLSLFACVGENNENSSSSGEESESQTQSSSGSESQTQSSSGSESVGSTESTDGNGNTTEATTESMAPDNNTDTEKGDVEEESETEDERLTAEYAPVKYFSAKDLYELTRDGVYEDMAQLFLGYDEVTYHKEEGKRPYTKLLAYNDYQTGAEAFISLCTGKMDVAPIFAVKYRTTTPGISMEIYTDSVNTSASPSNKVNIPVTSDGEWHIEYANLSRISQFNGKTVNYFRFDFMNASILPIDSYVEFEYVGFFNTEDDVEMFETGKYVPVIYVDPNSAYKECTTIVHASSIDMINGAGGVGAITFSYRGGNSTSGIDKFNHNGTTLNGGKLVFSGWTVVDGGIEKFVWSIDGLNWYDVELHQAGGLGDLGQPHINAAQNYTGAVITDVENAVKGGGYQGTINKANPEDRAKGLACNLLSVANVGDVVNVRFAAVPKNAPGELCLIAYVKNVEIVNEFVPEEETKETEIIDPTVDPEDCKEHKSSVYWYPVKGQLSEEKLCLLCGSSIDSRSPAFYSSFDFIEHNEGKINGGYGANQSFDKDGSAIVLRSGYDFVLQGWFACNGGVENYMYSVDGGETWLVCGNSDNLVDRFRPEHVAVITKADLGIANYDLKGMYRVNLPLLPFALEDSETTVNVLFGAKLANNPDIVITIASIKNIKIPAAPENTPEPEPEPDSEIKFIKAIDKLIIGGVTVNNPAGGFGGALFTYDAKDIKLTATTVTWQGWAGVNDGFSKWVYSVDGGNTWADVQGTAQDVPSSRNDIQGAITSAGFTNAFGKGMIAITADLSAYSGQTVAVIFGGVPNSDENTVCRMVEIKNVKIEGECPHVNVKWSHVSGENKESGSCSSCGETLTRTVKFLNNIDVIEGSRDGASHSVNPPDGIDLTSKPGDAIASRAGKDIVVQGWFAVNGGVQKYVYSIDGGETWLDCGNQPAYSGSKFMNSTPHQNAINGSDLGFTAADADVNGLYRVSCDLSDKAGETVSVIFGAVLEENPTAKPLQLLVVTVSVVQ